MLDDDLTTGVNNNPSDSNKKQWYRFNFADKKFVGAVFYFPKSTSQQNYGDVEVHVHDDENIDLNLQGTVCITFGPRGGVRNCNRMGSYVTLYCPTSCTPKLTIGMIRIWAERSISHEVAPII